MLEDRKWGKLQGGLSRQGGRGEGKSTCSPGRELPSPRDSGQAGRPRSGPRGCGPGHYFTRSVTRP